MADNALVLFRTHDLRVGNVDAKAFQESGVAANVNGDVVLIDIQHADMGRSCLVTERRLRPLANQNASLEVVGCKGRVRGFWIADRSVKRDDENASLARLLQGRNNRVIGSGDENTFGASGNQILNSFDLRSSIAVNLASIGLEFQAASLGSRFCAFLHLNKKRIGVVLGDQANECISSQYRRCRESRCEHGNGSQKLNLLHVTSPQVRFHRSAALALFFRFQGLQLLDGCASFDLKLPSSSAVKTPSGNLNSRR